MTKTTQYLFEFKDELTESPDNPIDFASHGIIDPKAKISMNIGPNEDIKENDDNKEILVNMTKEFSNQFKRQLGRLSVFFDGYFGKYDEANLSCKLKKFI